MSESLILFFSLCAVLTVLLSLVVIFPWLRRARAADNQLMAVNVAVFNERIRELDADKAAGFVDETHYQATLAELKRQLLDAQTNAEMYGAVGIKSRLIVLIWIPILVALAYLTTADRTSVFELWRAQDEVGQVADDLLTGKIDTPPEWAAKQSTALISAMQTNVHHHAHDADRWMRLSELFLLLDAKPQALETLSRAQRLRPDDQAIALSFAQTSFMANDGQLDMAARKTLQGVLATTPDHEGAMMLMAMGEARAGNYPMAKAWVAKLRSSIAAGSGDRSEALASLDTLDQTIDSQAQAAAQGVNISVQVAQSLLPKLQSTDTLFVAISAQSGGAPFAVKKLPASALKDGAVSVLLSDGDAMMPTRTLSAARSSGETLVVNARISHSGNATVQSGDFAANPLVLDKQKSLELTIDKITP